MFCHAQDSPQKIRKRCLRPSKSIELENKIAEGSGLTFWNDQLWAHNDSGNKSQLFSIDTATAKITATYDIPVPNKDWEDMTQDDRYFYIGDIGNNYHLRESLQIYRVDKQALLENRAIVDSIVFRWPEEISHDGKSRRRNYNCEAIVIAGDSIVLFTKEANRTAAYSIPKVPGNHEAKFMSAFSTKIHVTGAYFNPEIKSLVLCGYNKFLKTFVLDFKDFEGTDFFSAKVSRIKIRKRFRQTEGITSFDGRDFYLINEHFRQPWLLNVKQELHLIRL